VRSGSVASMASAVPASPHALLHAVAATMFLALRLPDGVEEPVHTTSRHRRDTLAKAPRGEAHSLTIVVFLYFYFTPCPARRRRRLPGCS
jgi:hypothetical protein